MKTPKYSVFTVFAVLDDFEMHSSPPPASLSHPTTSQTRRTQGCRHVPPMPRIVCHAVRTVRGAENTKSFSCQLQSCTRPTKCSPWISRTDPRSGFRIPTRKTGSSSGSRYGPWSRLVKAVFGDTPGARACHLGDSSTNGTLSATVLRQCWARKVGSVPQDCPGAGMSRELPRCPNNRRPVRADVSSAHIMMWCFRWLRDAERICASAMLIGHLHDTAFQ
jgi:hypothetical protein